jgi:hypothetical protein
MIGGILGIFLGFNVENCEAQGLKIVGMSKISQEIKNLCLSNDVIAIQLRFLQ